MLFTSSSIRRHFIRRPGAHPFANTELRHKTSIAIAAALLATAAVQAQEMPPGATVESVLSIARERNPEYAAMRSETQGETE